MSELKRIQILFRATIRMHRIIKQAAKRRGLKISQWMREAIDEKIAREAK